MSIFEQDIKTTEPEAQLDTKVKKFSIFDHWKNLTTQKEGYKEDDAEFVASYSPYMINRFASMTTTLLPLAAEIDRYKDIPASAHHMFYDSVIPKRYVKFEYMKPKKDITEESKEVVSRYFEFGSKDLELAMRILTTEDIETIKRKFGGSKK